MCCPAQRRRCDRPDRFFVCSTRPQHLSLQTLRTARVAESPDHNLAQRLVATIRFRSLVVVERLEVAELDETALAELPECPSEDQPLKRAELHRGSPAREPNTVLGVEVAQYRRMRHHLIGKEVQEARDGGATGVARVSTGSFGSHRSSLSERSHNPLASFGCVDPVSAVALGQGGRPSARHGLHPLLSIPTLPRGELVTAGVEEVRVDEAPAARTFWRRRKSRNLRPRRC